VIEGEGLAARARNLGNQYLAWLRNELDGNPAVRETRGLGLYFGVELRDHGGRASAELASRVLYRCLSEDLSFKNGGGNVLTLCPPLTIAETDLAQALAIVVRAIRAEAR
jgi:4-aminobutyrate aminotransferase